jgi:hypothetical protein
MLKKDDKSQQVVYYQVGLRKRIFVLVRQQFKRGVLGWDRDVHDSGDRDPVLGQCAKED